MTDSHAHIYLEQFDKDRSEMIERAKAIGVNRIYMPNIDHSSIDSMLKVEEEYPDLCISMMGLHPCSVQKGFEKELEIVEDLLSKRKWAAIGEIGLDLYWDKSTLDIQLEALKVQINLAKKYKLPIVLHCRDAFNELFDAIEKFWFDGLNGVFHCFTGTSDDLHRIKSLDFYIGIGGVLTFKNQSITELGEKMDVNRIVLETDSPYLAPTPNRGKRNEPANLEHIAKKLAEVLSIDLKKLEELTDVNCKNLFAL